MQNVPLLFGVHDYFNREIRDIPRGVAWRTPHIPLQPISKKICRYSLMFCNKPLFQLGWENDFFRLACCRISASL